MTHTPRPGHRARTLPTIGAALVLTGLCAAAVTAQDASYVASPISVGQRYFMAAHSFSALIGPDSRTGEPGPLAALAHEAELVGHENVGVQVIDGSTSMQHWNEGGGDESRNPAKVALRDGGIDVLAMSPNAVMPEEGIDRFGDLMIETNMEGRILAQVSWAPWDGQGRTAGVGGADRPDFSNEDHDSADVETIQEWIDRLHAPGGYLERLRTQLAGINERAGHEMAYVVPASDAVYRLRQEVLRGNVPGIDHQSELFVDGMGHPATPVANLVTYVWFTTMYRQPASGLTALVDPADPTSAAREQLLQQIAWDAVAAEPMSGLMVEHIWLGRTRGPHPHGAAEGEGGHAGHDGSAGRGGH